VTGDFGPRNHPPAREGYGKPGGRADAARRLDEAHKLLDELSNMLTEARREGRR
jgi:hypothetical protein